MSGLKKKLTQAENAVHRLERKKNKLRDAMADPKLYEGAGNGGGDDLAALQKKLTQVDKDLSAAEGRWEGLQHEWDREA